MHNMSYWKVFIKLMSKHWRSHLAMPLIVGIVVETSIGWMSLKDRSLYGLGQYLESWEGLGSHLGILSIVVTYLCVAVWVVDKDAKSPLDNDLGNHLNDLFNGATGFFATCTIPLKDWFHPTTQQYFSFLVKHKLSGRTFTQHRVLLFQEERALKAAKEQYLDAQYAKSLADIHHNYIVPLGYLRPREISEILKDFELTGLAAASKNRKVERHTHVSAEKSKGIISTLDFGVVGYPEKNKYRVFTFDKRGDSITLEEIPDPTPYVNLRNEIRKKVFNKKGLPGLHHDFASHCGLKSLEIEQPFVDLLELGDAGLSERANL